MFSRGRAKKQKHQNCRRGSREGPALFNLQRSCAYAAYPLSKKQLFCAAFFLLGCFFAALAAIAFVLAQNTAVWQEAGILVAALVVFCLGFLAAFFVWAGKGLRGSLFTITEEGLRHVYAPCLIGIVFFIATQSQIRWKAIKGFRKATHNGKEYVVADVYKAHIKNPLFCIALFAHKNGPLGGLNFGSRNAGIPAGQLYSCLNGALQKARKKLPEK